MTSKPYVKIIIFIVLAGLSVAGCKKTTRMPAEITQYGMTVTADSRPEEIARMLIAGLDNRDSELLGKLVAVQDARDEMVKILRRYRRSDKVTDEDAIKLTVAGWAATYSFYRPGDTGIVSETVDGDRATVIAAGRGKSTGESRTMTIELIREDGWWKVMTGIR